MWSFVGSKKNRAWIWLAMDLESRRIVAAWIGGRELVDAHEFANRIPSYYFEKQACVDTDRLKAYEHIFPKSVHTAWDKGSGMTNLIERFNLTLRTRLARLNRKSLCFSKSMLHHKAFIFNFIHHYNDVIAPRLAVA